MASGRPKQYLPLHGRALIEWSLAPFLDAEWIDGVVLVLARHDNGFAQLPIARHPRIITTVGGGARADSVLPGLEAVIARKNAFREVHVLVHDAARHRVQEAETDRRSEEARVGIGMCISCYCWLFPYHIKQLISTISILSS